MRVNVYAEELPELDSIEIIGKEINGRLFTGLRIPLYLPVTLPDGTQARGKFMHHPDDDDSSAITIWGKHDLRLLLKEALSKLEAHYDNILVDLPPSQKTVETLEPKYATNREGRLYNVESGVCIPDDEPVFILRSQDRHAVEALNWYLELCRDTKHSAEILAVANQFREWASLNPDLMKEPD